MYIWVLNVVIANYVFMRIQRAPEVGVGAGAVWQCNDPLPTATASLSSCCHLNTYHRHPQWHDMIHLISGKLWCWLLLVKLSTIMFSSDRSSSIDISRYSLCRAQWWDLGPSSPWSGCHAVTCHAPSLSRTDPFHTNRTQHTEQWLFSLLSPHLTASTGHWPHPRQLLLHTR